MARIGAAANSYIYKVRSRELTSDNVTGQFQPWPANSLNGNAGVESEPAQPKSKSKVKLNFGLSPDFSVQLKVSLSD